jgi:hypothetical protein
VPSHPSDPICEVFLDYEAGGAISLLQSWLQLSWSYDWTFAHGNTSGKAVDVPGIPKPSKVHAATHLDFSKAEIWVCDVTKKFNQNTSANMQGVKQKLVEQVSQKAQNVHPWID